MSEMRASRKPCSSKTRLAASTRRARVCAPRADRWMLYHHESTFAGAGMTHSSCRVYDEEGLLLASFAVDAMVRRFAGGGAADSRTAL